MANVKPRFMRRETYAGFKVPIVVDLVALGILIALTATVGLVWFGRRDIAQNQSITASLLLPPRAKTIKLFGVATGAPCNQSA